MEELFHLTGFLVTMMLVTGVGDQFKMLVTDLIHWQNEKYNEKSRQHNDSDTNISNRTPS